MQLQERVEFARLGDAKAHGLRGLRVASTGSEDSRESRIVVRRGEDASDGAHQADRKNITFQNESNYEISFCELWNLDRTSRDPFWHVATITYSATSQL